MNKANGQKLMSNWAYKLTAILAAVVIWIFITISQNTPDTIGYTVPVEPRGLAPNLAIDRTNYQVYVSVQGTAAAISNLRLADIEAYVDFTGLLAGEVTVDVVVNVPENMTVLSQNLKSITVELKEKRSNLFPLEVVIMGEPAANYKALEATVSPADVLLRGTDEYMRRVSKVYVTAPIQDVEADGFERDLSVTVLDTEGNDITPMFTIEPKVAKVVIPTVYKQPENTVAVRVPITGEPALGYKLSLKSVTPSTVRIFGDLNRVQTLDYVETEPVDISDLDANKTVTVRLALANGITADKSTVTVALQIEPVNYATVSKALVLAHNVGVDMLAEVEQQELQIMVYGPETFIATLDEADIVPYVDCADLAEGAYTLPIRVSLPANIMLMNISADTAEVTIYSTATPQTEDEQPLDGEQAMTPPEQGGSGT